MSPDAHPATHALRGEIAHCLGDPARHRDALQHFPDGLLLIHEGRVAELGPATELLARLPGHVPVEHRPDALILPGFVDCHTHYCQTDIIASPGEQLLNWLQRYTFPAERAFADPAHAARVAAFFCDQLLHHGTTTAMVFATVHDASVDALFAAARARHLRLITGKCLMDRADLPGLQDDGARTRHDALTLIERWHGVERLAYAIAPRFAPACSRVQMKAAGQLLAEVPGLRLHTHLAENREEVALAARLYPEARSYLDIYRHYGQLGPHSLFAHAIWLDDEDRRQLAAAGGAIAFCPSANLFLGSGLFDLAAADAAGVTVGLGSDVGAGTSLSLLRVLADAYKVLQLQGQSLSAERALYLATLGGARALGLDGQVGNLQPGKEADLVLLHPAPTPLMARRLAAAGSLAERLFIHLTLGDERSIAETRVLGRPAADPAAP